MQKGWKSVRSYLSLDSGAWKTMEIMCKLKSNLNLLQAKHMLHPAHNEMFLMLGNLGCQVLDERIVLSFIQAESSQKPLGHRSSTINTIMLLPFGRLLFRLQRMKLQKSLVLRLLKNNSRGYRGMTVQWVERGLAFAQGLGLAGLHPRKPLPGLIPG